MADEREPVGLGPRLTRARERAGLTQEELAARAYLSRGYLNRLETGRQADPSFEIIRRIARICRASLDYLGEMEDVIIDPQAAGTALDDTAPVPARVTAS